MPVTKEGFIEILNLKMVHVILVVTGNLRGGRSNAYQFESLLFHQAFPVPNGGTYILGVAFPLSLTCSLYK